MRPFNNNFALLFRIHAMPSMFVSLLKENLLVTETKHQKYVLVLHWNVDSKRRTDFVILQPIFVQRNLQCNFHGNVLKFECALLFACLFVQSTVTMVHDFRCNYSHCLTHHNRNRASFTVISQPNVIQYVYKCSITIYEFFFLSRDFYILQW